MKISASVFKSNSLVFCLVLFFETGLHYTTFELTGIHLPLPKCGHYRHAAPCQLFLVSMSGLGIKVIQALKSKLGRSPFSFPNF